MMSYIIDIAKNVITMPEKVADLDKLIKCRKSIFNQCLIPCPAEPRFILL